MINVVCVRVGTKYGPEYVEILRDMVLRNASLVAEPIAFWCLTDAPDELPDGVQAIPAPAELPGWWAKVALFSPNMPWPIGQRVVFLDLDVAITGRLEELFSRKGIIQDWLWPCYNSSVMVWDHGEHAEVWTKFKPSIITSPGHVVPSHFLPSGQINGGDQEWITQVAPAGSWPVLPSRWCVSFSACLTWPATDAKVISFNGDPKPHQVEEGWVKDVWRVGGFTSLPVMDGANVDNGQIIDNVRASTRRELPWFTGFPGSPDRRQLAVVVGGAPSMLESIAEIRAHRRRGARIVTVNNAWRVLAAKGIVPDVHIMLDARQENAEFVRDAPAGMRFLIASQCHPAVFEALKDREVVLWHNGFGDNAELLEVLSPWWGEGPNQRPCVLVPGGGTVGLRALWLCCFSGYRKIHVYGMDSSYEGEAHHAYAQPLNDDEAVQEVAMGGKRYRCARWMVRQAEEFKQAWRDLQNEGVSLFVHGRGLIPDIAKDLRGEARAA